MAGGDWLSVRHLVNSLYLLSPSTLLSPPVCNTPVGLGGTKRGGCVRCGAGSGVRVCSTDVLAVLGWKSVASVGGGGGVRWLGRDAGIRPG